MDALQEKFFKYARENKVKNLVLAGGVAANSRLREVFKMKAEQEGYNIFFPSLQYCTDNAAMIARAGVEEYRENNFSDLNLKAIPNLKL